VYAVNWRSFGDIGVLMELDRPDQVGQWCAAIDASDLPMSARPGWNTVLVTSAMAPTALIEALQSITPVASKSLPSREYVLPVTYNGEDLHSVGILTGLSVEEVVRRHCTALYTVVFLGFSRGFAYLSGLDPLLSIPRRDSPRLQVPAGSVGIAAGQTGVYPQASPGGWHLLGTCTEVLFDEMRTPPSVLQPGDHVRFVAQ
jgi:KipI family sensor histidine kinase inhibitor